MEFRESILFFDKLCRELHKQYRDSELSDDEFIYFDSYSIYEERYVSIFSSNDYGHTTANIVFPLELINFENSIEWNVKMIFIYIKHNK